MIAQISRRLKSDTAADGSQLRPSDYMPVIKALDSQNLGSVEAKEILKFLEKHLRTYA
jgi:hypothetical protein